MTDNGLSLNLINVKAFYNNALTTCGIHASDGKIQRVAKSINLPAADTKIDCSDLIALPGLIDVHVHLRDLELSHKEDVYTGSAAAAVGGFTSILDMPNTQPPTDSLERLTEKMAIAEKKTVINTGFHVAPPRDPVELEQMKRAGAFSCKFYMLKPIGEVDVRQPNVLRHYFKLCKGIGLPATIHSEDGQWVKAQLAKMKRPLSLKDFLRIHNPSVEYNAAKSVIEAASAFGTRTHFCHITSQRTLALIQRARTKLPLTCEVTPHHLLLDHSDMAKIGPLAATVPPLRSANDKRKLFSAFRRDMIDVLATDHAPHSLSEKQQEDYSIVAPGIPGLETALPLMMTLVNRGRVSLRSLIDHLARRPAQIFGIKRKGFLGPGADADITLVDPRKVFKINSTNFRSKARHSPFEGRRCIGGPVMTFVGGRLVMDHGEIVANAGAGTVLRSL